MKIIKKEAGITLIALIITIIVLVVLAAVSIRAVYNMGIVDRAVNGVQDYAKAAVEENKMMDNTVSFIERALGLITGNGNDISGGTGGGTDSSGTEGETQNEPDSIYNKTMDKYYDEMEDAINEARTDDELYLAKNYELKDNLTIPTGVTFIVPTSSAFDDTVTGNNEPDGDNATTAYVTLIIPQEVTLDVEGTLLVAANQTAGTENSLVDQGVISGAYGQIINNGKINVKGDAKLYARGYITGTGDVEALSGATVYQLMQVLNTVLPEESGSSFGTWSYDSMIKGVSPLKNYYVQNILTTQTYNYNSRLLACAYLMVIGSVEEMEWCFIGDEGLYRMSDENSSIVILYDYSIDRQELQIKGSINIESVSWTWFEQLGINNAIFYIGHQIINIKNGGTLNLNHDVQMLPGVDIVIDEGGILNISETSALFLWDASDFDSKYVYKTGTEWRKMLYGAVMEEKAGQVINETQSARLIINGQLNAIGNVCNSPNGDNVIIRESGTVNAPNAKDDTGNTKVLGVYCYDAGAFIHRKTVKFNAFSAE